MPLRYTQDFGRLTRACSGRVLVPDPNYADNFSNVTLVLILLPVALFFGFELDYMWRLAKPLPVAVGALFAVSMASLFTAMLTEPGILRHQPGLASPSGSGRRELLVDVGDGVGATPIVISLAQANRDPYHKRAKYCKQIECVVERFDHFCPWVGNAIGLRNYRFFLAFVLSTTLLAATVGGACAARLYYAMADAGRSGLHSFVHTAFSLEASGAVLVASLLSIYCFFVSLLMCGLCSFHLCLLVRVAETTNEYLKAAFDEMDNPHDRGCLRNYARALCAATPRSKLQVWKGKDPMERCTPLARSDSLSQLEAGAAGAAAEGGGAGGGAGGGEGGSGAGPAEDAGGGGVAEGGGGGGSGCFSFGRATSGGQPTAVMPVPATAADGSGSPAVGSEPAHQMGDEGLLGAGDDGGTAEAVAHYRAMTGMRASMEPECDGEQFTLAGNQPRPKSIV